MKNIIIGVTPRINHSDNNTFVRVHRNYIDRLTKIGLIPIIITPGSNYKKILEFCDGFLVIGGDDYNPVMYGDTNDLGLSKEINDEMDKLDQDIILYAVEKEKPVLGICRGHQGFSAVFGKALYQDIESAGLNHPVTDKLHEVTKVTNIGVAKLLPDKFTTNTFHHQATKDLPKGFAVLFKNHDVVEAIEHTTLPLLGIQWHPERMETKESDIIFNYFKDMFK
ncbi:MAG: gamma-glutamyl-gamma-aminobutyrate hydrolase family protein [Bacilli bacterium]|nr:gamma-glutamyl-gamma-aminobutyrate hydrolase family protein [Mollicutes bacterium]MDY3898970.1 gamma-glutamyl-gamma-aminobutyrate hydrolase family protein [Bacilli bacterium]